MVALGCMGVWPAGLALHGISVFAVGGVYNQFLVRLFVFVFVLGGNHHAG